MESLFVILFYFISILLILSAFGLVFSKKKSHYISFALISNVAISGYYFLLNADFNAVIQILVATFIVIFLYSTNLYLLGKNGEEKKQEKNNLKKWQVVFCSVVLVVFLFAGILALISNCVAQDLNNIVVLHNSLNPIFSTIYNIGENLLTNYIIAFESLGVLLFVVIVYLTLKKQKEN